MKMGRRAEACRPSSFRLTVLAKRIRPLDHVGFNAQHDGADDPEPCAEMRASELACGAADEHERQRQPGHRGRRPFGDEKERHEDEKSCARGAIESADGEKQPDVQMRVVRQTPEPGVE